MDPNKTLAEMLNLTTIIAMTDESELAEIERAEIASRRLAELVVAMDEWLKGGGFLPWAWEKPRIRKGEGRS